MAIIFDENNRLITLNTKNSTYQMKIDEYGFLLHLYYGKRTNGNMDYILVNLDRGFSGNPYDAGDNRKYSLDALLQEFPCRGAGDFRSPVFEVRYEDGSFGCDLRYESHIIKDGKYGLSGLPAVYENSDMDKAQTLEITLSDKVSGIKVILYYGIIESLDIITRAANVINENKNNIYIEKLQSACLDFVSGNFDLITFYGRHAMERNIQRQSVGHGSYRIGSRRGTSSHQYNPLMILADSDANEDYGNCYAMSFVYSGGFLGEAEKDQYGQTRMQLGLMEEQFSYCLKSGESIIAPEVIMSYSDRGLAVLSQNLHKCIRENVCRGKYKNEVRPVLVNSWEASYFDIDKNSIVNLAKNAAELGVEMLVMDDGWFGKRDDDNSGLGDWFTNENKIGCSLKELVESVNNCGIKFGIWVEPEMVNEDSDLYRKHPDWAFAVPGKKPVRSRNQLVLDFSRKEVVDYIYDSITKVIESGNIEYIKWDMNRSIANVYSSEDKYQGNVYYDYVLGLYDFLERLNKNYPDILIEGCSGGGGRFDAGMLYYTPQIWCSDNTDAIDRTKIQYGTSFGYPVSAVGAHVSAVPNHQTGRSVSIDTRGVVAMSGSFGYELDLGKVSEAEKNTIKEQIKTFKKEAELIHNGLYYRLSDPYKDPVAAWEFVSKDGDDVLVNVVCLKMHGNMQPLYVRFKGLNENVTYKDVKTGKIYPAEALMNIGMPFMPELGEYQSWQVELKRC
jgi:hypothetical protein